MLCLILGLGFDRDSMPRHRGLNRPFSFLRVTGLDAQNTAGTRYINKGT
jgi:hypothetical protein